MKFEDLWPHLEQFSDDEIAEIYQAASSDKIYRAQFAGTLAAYALGLVAISFAVPALYRIFHPALPVRVSVAVTCIAAIYFGAKSLFRLGPYFLNNAVIRQVKLRDPGNGP